MTGEGPPASPNRASSSSSPSPSPAHAANTAFFYPHQEDDFSYYYSFLQDPLALAPLPLGMPASGKGRRPDALPEDPDPPRKRRRSREAITELLTSIAALREADGEDRDAASSSDMAALEANHREAESAMLGYYSSLQEHFSDLEDSGALRARASRMAASAAAAAAASPEAKPSPPLRGQAQPQRRLWVKDRSKAWWERCCNPEFPEEEFRAAFRMSRATFDFICEELGSSVAKEDTMLRTAIPVPQRVAVCIWRLATGDPLRLVSKRFGLGISTCHKLVLEVCAAIKQVLMPRFLQWPDPAAVDAIKRRFEASSGIPGVIGSMYTTHIPIIAPKISIAAYYNKRHTERNQKTSYSITVQGVVDPDGLFTDVCIGWPGSMPDDQVLEKSALYRRAASGSLKNHWVVGGAGYPLMDWVLVPYAQQNLTWTQHAFNEKVGEVQRVVREAFTRLKGRWKCLQKRTEVKLQDLPNVLGACCVLHNVCELRKEEMAEELRFELVDDEMVPENPVVSAGAKMARDNIAHMLLHHGLAGTAFFQ